MNCSNFGGQLSLIHHHRQVKIFNLSNSLGTNTCKTGWSCSLFFMLISKHASTLNEGNEYSKNDLQNIIM